MKLYFLYITEPVVISTAPISITEEEGTQGLFVTCIAIGHPLPNIKWYGPNGELMNGDSSDVAISSFMSGLNTKTSHLVIRSLNYTHNGTYNCTATNSAHGVNNPLDTDTKTFTITVQSK